MQPPRWCLLVCASVRTSPCLQLVREAGGGALFFRFASHCSVHEGWLRGNVVWSSLAGGSVARSPQKALSSYSSRAKDWRQASSLAGVAAAAAPAHERRERPPAAGTGPGCSLKRERSELLSAAASSRSPPALRETPRKPGPRPPPPPFPGIPRPWPTRRRKRHLQTSILWHLRKKITGKINPTHNNKSARTPSQPLQRDD